MAKDRYLIRYKTLDGFRYVYIKRAVVGTFENRGTGFISRISALKIAIYLTKDRGFPCHCGIIECSGLKNFRLFP